MFTAEEIRQRFLRYFQQNGHTLVASSSLVPYDDPSLLFTNAGMVQFKNIFQGHEKRPYSRATTAQKCLRVGGKHNDLENVGRTARHHTFFEMLGNFSFGDYFKKDAIMYAWRFLTEELGLPKERLYVTVYREDEEARQLWLENTDVRPDHIFRMGEKDNFWSMGPTGPCGPCSEILIDQGEHMKCGENCGIGKCDCDRFLEIWNLVFMQYNQLEDGRREPLPRPSIDTGMGLERIAAVCQGVYSNYDSDLFQRIIAHIAEMGGVGYSGSAPDTNEIDTALRVIADHSRAIAFMVADGIVPANEGRGYVLRRLIRRAYRFGRFLGFAGPFLFRSAQKVCELMGEQYPELRQNEAFMAKLVREEEERFHRTLDKGLAILQETLDAMKRDGTNVLSGEVAFRLYDTYGFPVDIINDIVEKQGITVDADQFGQLMREQRERAKAKWKGAGAQGLAARFGSLLEDGIRSEFIGYETLQATARVISLLDENTLPVSLLPKGEKGYLITGKTPFYGESGGQAGDTGTIKTATGRAEVTDTLKPAPTLIVQRIEVSDGEVFVDQEAELSVTSEARKASARNHTCTHLLHAALRQVLGTHVRQAGSLVTPERLRFDFLHTSPLTPKELADVEYRVNRAIMSDLPVTAKEMSQKDALAMGAMALFGEKYGDTVRTIRIENESMELCGGTHLSRTGEAGSFFIISEGGVAAGTRRIEAVTGWNAAALCASQRSELQKLGHTLKCQPGEVGGRVEQLRQALKNAEREIERLNARGISESGADLLEANTVVNGVPLLAAQVKATNVKMLREVMDDARSRLASGIICLGAAFDGKATIVVNVSKDLLDRYRAPDLIRSVAEEIKGTGGGRPDMAQAGGSDPGGLERALNKIKTLL